MEHEIEKMNGSGLRTNIKCSCGWQFSDEVNIAEAYKAFADHTLEKLTMHDWTT